MVARSTGRRRCTGLLPRTVKIPAEVPGSVVSEAGSYRVSAAGLLGEQPLVTWNNAGKGTRQTRSVTSGQGLALRIEAGLVGWPQRSPRGRAIGLRAEDRSSGPRPRHPRRRSDTPSGGQSPGLPVPATPPALVAAEGADQPREVSGAALPGFAPGIRAAPSPKRSAARPVRAGPGHRATAPTNPGRAQNCSRTRGIRLFN